MKRLWVAVFILIIVISVCVGGRQYQMRAIDGMIDTLNQLDEADDGDMATARRMIEELYDDFERKSKVLDCFMNHEDVDGVKSTMDALLAASQHHAEQDVLAAIEAARLQLIKLRDIDSVRIENIL